MPLYDYRCNCCGKVEETFQWKPVPVQCCGEVMTRLFTLSGLRIKDGPPLWTGRIDEIHKAQADRGERLRYVYPQEVGAT